MKCGLSHVIWNSPKKYWIVIWRLFGDIDGMFADALSTIWASVIKHTFRVLSNKVQCNNPRAHVKITQAFPLWFDDLLYKQWTVLTEMSSPWFHCSALGFCFEIWLTLILSVHLLNMMWFVLKHVLSFISGRISLPNNFQDAHVRYKILKLLSRKQFEGCRCFYLCAIFFFIFIKKKTVLYQVCVFVNFKW